MRPSPVFALSPQPETIDMSLFSTKRVGGLMRKLVVGGLVIGLAAVVWASSGPMSVPGASSLSWTGSSKSDERSKLARPRPIGRPSHVSASQALNENSLPVNGSAPRLPPLSVRLAGSIDPVGGNASAVVVRVDGQPVPVTLSGDGFVANLDRVSRHAMVDIQVSKSGAAFTALVGSVLQLKRQAGADGTVVPSENPSLRVSPLSTAIHFFVMRELGGRLPITDRELDSALHAIFPDDLGPAMNMLHLTAAGQIALPAGYSNGHALLANQTDYRLWVDANRNLVRSFETRLREQPGAPFATVDTERSWLSLGRIPLGGALNFATTSEALLKTPSGYEAHSFPGRRNASFSRQLLSNGDLELTPIGAVYRDTVVSKPFLAGNYIDVIQRRTVASERYRRIFIGDRSALWLRTRVESVGYPDYPSQLPEYVTTTVVIAMADFDRTLIPFEPAQLSGRRGMQMFCPGPTSLAGQRPDLLPCQYAVHVMGASGSGTIEGVGSTVDELFRPIVPTATAAFQWTLEADGGLRVSGPGYSFKAWRLGLGDGLIEPIMYVATAQDANGSYSHAGRSLILDSSGQTGFSQDDPLGQWKYASFGDERGEYAYHENSPLVSTTFERAADGNGWRRDTLSDGNAVSVITYRSSWQLWSGQLYETRYQANIPTGIPGTSGFHTCEQAFAQGATVCAPLRVRHFRPFAKVGNRWYGIEDDYLRTSGLGATPITFTRLSRANVYRPI